MKLTTLLSTTLQLLAITPALACLEARGQVSTTGHVLSINVIDNGAVVCSDAWGWRIDQDNHISVNCLAGYIYAVKKDGSLAWYRNPVNAYSFPQLVAGGGDTLWWDQYEFC